MQPDDEDFRALARSSPWRWHSLHFRHTSASGEVEAWLRRPGHLRVREADGTERVETGLPYTCGPMLTFTRLEGTDTPPPVLPARLLPHQVEPVRRPDGLVAERPSGWNVDYDDPMYGNYMWVAMLDPVELSHHTSITELRAENRLGRSSRTAHLRAGEGYRPRCPCCPLLWSAISDAYDNILQSAGTTYPDGWQVTMDLETAVVVSIVPVGGSRPDSGFEVEILGVDEGLG